MRQRRQTAFAVLISVTGMTRRSPSRKGLPRWLPIANTIVMFLNRRGMAVGTQHILTIAGRATGKPRSTPVSIVSVAASRYIVSTGSGTQWVKNARSAKQATLRRGRHVESVVLVEVPLAQRGPILREFPVQVPGGMSFLEGVLGSKLDSDALVAAAAELPVFRIDRA